MNEILKNHLEIAKKSCGTGTGKELLCLENISETNFAANLYLIALKQIEENEAQLGEARRLLKEVEFSANADGWPVCPICYETEKHDNDCGIASFLNKNK